jgi:branched-chain amino acid transport system permease protein
VVALFIWAVTSLAANGVAIRQWLAQLTPDAVRFLSFGMSPVAAAAVAWAALVIASLLGALLSLASQHNAWGAALRARRQGFRAAVQKAPPIRHLAQYRQTRRILVGAGMLLLLLLPLVLGQYWNYNLGTVGIYVLLGLGLNIVVGLAGLLDLGYVAFFAIGAYTLALLTAPTPHGIELSFWLALPISVLMAALAGALLGIPVLRMRGDYLAIVTLGFGEIIRILARSDVLTSFTGGPRGVRDIAGPSLFGLDLSSELHFVYLILIGIALVAYVTNRLQVTRVGRAWMAMREDEDVAAAMGVYTLRYKLLAFAIGAAFAGLGGALYASRNQFTGPEDFVLLVSINVLCVVIIGGMGSIPGVIIGAVVLKGIPEVLRQLADFRMLAFGALLIFMMIARPEGLWPSRRRQMELHRQEAASGASPAPQAGEAQDSAP